MKRIAFLIVVSLLIGCGGGGGGGGNGTNGAAPVVATSPATLVGSTTATLNGNATANGLPTNAWFEWGTDSTLTTSTSTSSQSIGSGTTSQAVNAALTGLSTGTTYYYRVVASNSSGTTSGSIQSFTPVAAPVVATSPATLVGTTTATLNGNVTANGLPTNAWFEWGTDPSLASPSSTSSHPVGSGTTSQAASAALTGLSTGTTYYYRVVASNSSGTTLGNIVSFATSIPNTAPAVDTLPATLVGTTTATLNGNVTANGLPTNAWFEWGTDPSLASPSSTPSHPVGSGTTSQAVNAVLTGLSTGTTYYYRIVASNSLGTTLGNIANFIPDYVGSYSGTYHNNTSGLDNVVGIIITAYSTTTLTGTINTNNAGTIAFSSGYINGFLFHAVVEAIFDTTTMDGTFTSDGLTLSGTFLIVSKKAGVPDVNGTFTVTKQ